ncbi:hypothetical protein DFH29DRAFT_468718 [Suillus ampliporus]|nr:hypothetical protein DFH29DRAFT_468718 [Suillus ampliporus]
MHPPSGHPSGNFHKIEIMLLRLSYVNVAIAFLWVYDYLTTISNEINFLLHGRWTKTKLLYLVCRYLPFVFVTLGMLTYIRPALSQTMTMCKLYYSLNIYIGGVILFCAECIFVARTCALWGYKRSIVVFFLISVVLYLISIIVILIIHASSTRVMKSPIPSVSCFDYGEDSVVLAAYSLLILAEFQILFFSLRRAAASFRNWGHENRLLEILVQHNIFYFACGLCSSGVVILTKVLLQASYGHSMASAQVVFHALLVTKMHLRLWESERHHDLP